MKLSRMLSVSLRLLLVGIVLFAVIYPLLVGGVGQIWSNKSQGSLIQYNGQTVGSRFIGQKFNEPYHFYSRPSAIDYQTVASEADINYEKVNSGSANLGPNNPELSRRVEGSLQKLSEEETAVNMVPADLVTESGSALDPHISPEAAYLQIPRVAAEAGIADDELEEIVEEMIEPRFLGLYGGERVNVLELNLRLEKEVLNR
ncbi:MAG: K(+)-transporting ATPase subunit C [Halanaerobiales bacterium]